MNDDILLEMEDGVGTVTLNRPDRLNALAISTVDQLVDALGKAAASDEVRVVVLAGNGRRFCAGADLSEGGSTFAKPTASVGEAAAEPSRKDRDGGGLVSLRIFELKKPIIAAINGPAVGVGVTMTLPMDIRLVSEKSKIGFVFARRGIVNVEALLRPIGG